MMPIEGDAEQWTLYVNIFGDSQLVINQVNDIYLARGEKMVIYLDKAK